MAPVINDLPSVPGRQAVFPVARIRSGPQYSLGDNPSTPVQQGTSMADEWPLQSFLELGALAGAVPSARLHTRQVVFEWGLGPLERSAELVVSELVTNAVLASQAQDHSVAVRLWLLSDKTSVLVLVHDASSQPPMLLRVAPDAERGRGLMLVDAVSEEWGWYAPSETTGKVVWALVSQPLADPAVRT